jgi:hypothetical protein
MRRSGHAAAFDDARRDRLLSGRSTARGWTATPRERTQLVVVVWVGKGAEGLLPLYVSHPDVARRRFTDELDSG